MSDADTIRKPVYDARQKFIELLMKRLEAAGDAISDGDTKTAHVQLEGVASLVKPWIRPDDYDRITKKLLHSSRMIHRVSSATNEYQWARQSAMGWNGKAERLLMDITTDLTTSSKHLMMPSDTDMSGDMIGVDEFLRRSGA